MPALYFVPPRGAFIDPQTGELTRTAILFLKGMFDRVGGADGMSIPELSDRVETVATELAMVPDATAAVQSLLAVVADLRAIVEIADQFTASAAPAAEIAKRCADLETLGAFTQ